MMLFLLLLFFFFLSLLFTLFRISYRSDDGLVPFGTRQKRPERCERTGRIVDLFVYLDAVFVFFHELAM